MGSSKVTAIVTGVGAIIGYGVIKNLRNSGIDVHIIGTDIYNDAVGRHWCDQFIQAPYAVSDGYIPFLQDTIGAHQADIVFFGTEQEIYKCVRCKDELGSDYRKLVINKPEILELAHDKWAMQQRLESDGLGDLIIPSVIEGDYGVIADLWGPAFLLKPRSSYASKGIHVVHDEEEFDFYRVRMGEGFMAQQLVGDDDHEYTVGVFGLGDGSNSGMIQMRRKLSQEGATAKAATLDDSQLAEAVDRICHALKPVGPTNMQFRYHEDSYKLLEVNPRISSSTSIRAAFGYNEALMSINYFLAGHVTIPVLRNGSAQRFIDDYVSYDA